MLAEGDVTSRGPTTPWKERFASRARLDSSTEIATIMALAGRTDLISFSGGFPDPAALDRAALASIARDISSSTDPTAFQYAPTEGLPGLRAFIAERLSTLEHAHVGAGDLIVTSGGIEAIQLVSMVFLESGDAVVVEAPTYLGAQLSFASHGAQVVTATLDDGGMDVEALERELVRGLRPKLLYTNPDHQNPAGVTLTADRRRALIELALRYEFLVVEDVAYREFCYGREPEQSLWALAPEAVLQIGTFSKIFSPGVRLGWAVGPAAVVERLAWAKQFTDQCASAFSQRLVEEYGRRGCLDVQIATAKALYQERCHTMLACLDAEMPPDVTWTRPHGGFFTWLQAAAGSRGDRRRQTERRRRGRARARSAVFPGRTRAPLPADLLQPGAARRDRRGRAQARRGPS